MATTEKNANAFDMTSLTAVSSGYSLMLINNSTNEGQLIRMTDLANMILNEGHIPDDITDRIDSLENRIAGITGGVPTVVSSTSEMTDTDKIYILSTDGKWYYHDGSTWVAGGEYGGVAAGSITTDKLTDGAVTAAKIASGVIPVVDTTLTQPGSFADAKKTGDELTGLKSAINNIEPWKAWASKYIAQNGGVGGLGVTASFKGNSIGIKTAQSAAIGRMIILSNTPRVYGGTQGNFTPLESDLLPIEILESEYIKISSFIKSEDTETTDRYCTIGLRTFAKNSDGSFTSLAYLNTSPSNVKANTLQKPFIGKIPSGATHFLVSVFFSGGIRERSLEIVYSIEPFNMDAITAATQALVLENTGG